MTKLIPVQFAIVDDDDYEELCKYTWKALGSGHVVRYENGCPILMHRVIMDAPVDLEVDHKNGCSADNRKENLRICTHAQNMKNRKISNLQGKSSKYKGVYKSDKGAWRAEIRCDGKKYTLGRYDDEEAAARAYDAAARFYFGEFARTNLDGDTVLSAEQIRKLRGQPGQPPKRKGKTSIYTGVWLEKDKWRAGIYTEGHKKKDLGHFNDETEAARAYDAAAKSLHGDSAELNFPEERE